MLMTKPSRELRLHDQVTEGPLESIAFQLYTGDAGTLAKGIDRLELTVEYERSKAVEGLAAALRAGLTRDGYMVVADIDRAVEDFHADELA